MLKSIFKPVNIDAILYTGIGVFTAFQLGLSGEDSYKYVNPHLLFWMKWFLGGVAAGFLGLKTYRSTEFAKHKDETKIEENRDKSPAIAVNDMADKMVAKVTTEAEGKLNV